MHKTSSGADNGEEDNGVDRRWIRCRRPAVVVGGELTVEMLELQFNPATKFYTAPLQMKANNGVLIIDDFGRQRMRPEELLFDGSFPWIAELTSSIWLAGRTLKSPSRWWWFSPPTWIPPN